MKNESFIHSGESTLVLPDLLRRLSGHSPELVILIEQYLQLNGEGVQDRLTHSGGDSSGRMMFFLVESLLTFEQLRLEVHGQINIHREAGELVPGNLMLAASDLLVLEPGLIQALSTAFEIHLQVWDAQKMEYLSSAKPSKADEKPEDSSKAPPSDRGRWGKTSGDQD